MARRWGEGGRGLYFPSLLDLDVLAPGAFVCLTSAGLGQRAQTSTNLPRAPGRRARTLACLCGQAAAADLIRVWTAAGPGRLRARADILLPPSESDGAANNCANIAANRSPSAAAVNFNIIPNSSIGFLAGDAVQMATDCKSAQMRGGK